MIGSNEKIFNLNLAKIKPNPFQPRKEFNIESIKELADDIKKNGLLHPIRVYELFGQEQYFILVGERRYRAFKYLQETEKDKQKWEAIPAIITPVQTIDEVKENMAILSLTENIKREDLTPVEKADAIEKIKKEFTLTYTQIGEKIGLKESTIKSLISNIGRLSQQQKKTAKEKKYGMETIKERYLNQEKKKKLAATNFSSKKAETTSKIGTEPLVKSLNQELREKERVIKQLEKKLITKQGEIKGKDEEIEKMLKERKYREFVDKIWNIIESIEDEKDKSVIRSLILEKME